MTPEEVELAKRRLLFVPCETAEELHTWIRVYFGLNIPNCTVDPKSTSNPMDLIFEIYNRARKGDENFSDILAFAARDSFKCVEKGTFILSLANGLQKIEDVRIGDLIWSGTAWRPVTDWIDDGVKESCKLTLENGAVMATSPIHRVWAWSPNSLPGWKKVSELTKEDLVCWDTGSNFAGKNEIDQQEFETGYLCGILQGDGCLRFMEKLGRITLSSNDPYVLSFWKRACLKYVGREPKQSKSRPCDWIIYSRAFCDLLMGLGLTPSYSWEKDFPDRCLRNPSVIAGFISGLLDTDGSVSSRQQILFNMTAETLLRKLQAALAALGVTSRFSSHRLNPKAGQKHQVFSVVVSQNETPNLWRAGVRVRAKKANFSIPASIPDAHDSIPRPQVAALLASIPSKGSRRRRIGRKPSSLGTYKNITRAKLEALLRFALVNSILSEETVNSYRKIVGARWFKVRSVESGRAHFYDLTVDSDHSYWSNGMISHNTLSAAVLEMVIIIHLMRDVAHMAATLSQSANSQKYVKRIMNRPIIRDFISKANERRIEFTRYTHGDVNISPLQWAQLSPGEQELFVPNTNYLQIVVATDKGANCVAPDSMVTMEDGEQCRADAVVVGDSVLSYDLLESRWHRGRVGTISKTTKPAILVTFEDGGNILLSEDHRVLTDQGWRTARTLKIGQKTVGNYLVHRGEYSGNSPPIRNAWSVLIGSLLGDASLTWPAKKNGRYGRGPRFQVSHVSKHMGYLKVKQQALKMLGIDSKIVPDGHCHKLFSVTSPQLGWLYRMLYGSGKKTITPEILEYVDAEALAYWFMDDARGNAERVGSVKDHCLELATCCFSRQENELVSSWFWNRWGIHSKVCSVTNQSKKRYPIVKLSLASSRKLSALVDPYLYCGLKYKFPAPEGLRERTCLDCCEPSGTSIRCVQHSSNYDRNRAASLKKHANRTIKSLEFKGDHVLIDLHIETQSPYLKNFVCNGQVVHNSEHVPFFVMDELDLAPPGPVEESRMIPTQTKDGKPPITFMTSTRKYDTGLVQDVIDHAEDTNTQVRHWNLIDVTKPCSPTRHRPDLPKIPIYNSEADLKALSEKEFQDLPPEARDKYSKMEGFAGCLSNCRLFPVCQGRLATKQTATSPMLKNIAHVQQMFRKVSLDTAKAQLMCWQPSSEGKIYSRLNKDVHLISAAEMAEKITGDKYPETFGKKDLIALFKARGASFFAGVDHGFSHFFTCITGAVEGNRLFVIDALGQAQLEISQKVEQLTLRFEDIGVSPVIFPDPEDPASNKTLARSFSVRNFKKGAGSVMDGIQTVRAKLNPVFGAEPELYFLKGDEGVEALVLQMKKYGWKIDNTGRPTQIPDKKDDDLCFTADTEVLTLEGWKSLAEVSQQDSVLAVEPSGSGFWEKPLRVIDREYSGKMYRIEHPHLEFSATSDHEHAFMRQIDWKAKGKFLLKKGTIDSLPAESYWANNITAWSEGPGVFDGGSNEAWLAGFWLAEGCFDVHRPTYIIWDQKKPGPLAECRKRILSLGWKLSETNRGLRLKRIVVSGQGGRVSLWKSWFGDSCYNKTLPTGLIMKMTREERLSLWEGYMAGDGCRTQSLWHFDSASKALTDGLQILSLTLGYGCRIVQYPYMKDGVSTKIFGRGIPRSAIWRGHVLRKKPVAHISKKEFCQFDYSGKVYCVETSTGAFLARSNGKVFVAGNCDGLRYLVMNVFNKLGKIVIAAAAHQDTQINQANNYTQDNWMHKKIDELTADGGQDSGGQVSSKSGKFHFSF